MPAPGDYLPDPTEGISRVEDLPTPDVIADEIVAVRWQNYRMYPKSFVPSGGVSYPMYGVSGNRMEQNGYPAVFNIEADTRE